jgi:Ca-activated chloride channel family protein
MRLCSKPLRGLLISILFAVGFAYAGPAARAQSQAPPPAPEPQKPLNIDRDPIPSPDPADNQSGIEAPRAVPSDNGANSPLAKGDHGYTLRRDVEEVVLNCTVLDDKNKLVMNLTKSDFKVTEDGVPQNIISFQHEDIPVSMGILVDNSGSMRDKRQAVNSSALDLVKASNRDDEAFIVNFSDEAYIDQDFTSDIGKLRDGLGHIDSKGGTALYDAVVASADQLAKGAKRSKQVLLVITDGEDNASVMSLEQTIQRIQALQGPVVYSIGLLFKDEGGGREARRARRALQLLSDQTGGVAYFPKTLGEVDEIAAEVARDIRSQYTIGYHSTKAFELGGYRIVKVEAHAQGYGKLTVRTKSGYYPTVKGAPTAPDKTRKADARQPGSE